MVAIEVLWPSEHDEELKRQVDDGRSYAQAAAFINQKYHTAYSRSACIGRARRMRNGPKPQKPQPVGMAESRKRTNDKKREKRWAANPSLAQRAQRIKEMKETRAKMLATKTPKTAAAYRKHLPKLRTMTRSELRAMLTQAVQNTAAMEVS